MYYIYIFFFFFNYIIYLQLQLGVEHLVIFVFYPQDLSEMKIEKLMNMMNKSSRLLKRSFISTSTNHSPFNLVLGK